MAARIPGINEEELRRVHAMMEALEDSSSHLALGVARLEERAANFNSEWDRVREELVRLRTRIDLLAKKVIEGNGEDSLVVQVRLLAQSAANLEDRILLLEEGQLEFEKTHIQGKWKVAEKAVTALIAALSAVLMFLLKEWVDK